MARIEKVVFFAGIAFFITLASFGFGLYSGAKKNVAYDLVKSVKEDFDLVLEESGNILSSGPPIHYLQPARDLRSGVTVNDLPDDDSLVLISSYFDGGTELRLIQRDGTVVRRWPVRFSEHFPDTSHLEVPPSTDRNIDIHGVLLNSDGSVVFNYEFGGTVKLDKCGSVIWTLAHPTHHSLERSQSGGYWIAGRDYIRHGDGRAFRPFTNLSVANYFEEDLVLKVSEDGEILDRKSVPEILYENGLESVMTATGYSFQAEAFWDTELVHLNKIGELPKEIADDFPEFRAGDLVLSMRKYNLLVVVEPGTWAVKWHQTGPWRRQHDPEFRPGGKISLFNNNTYRIDLDNRNRVDLNAKIASNIMEIDVGSGEVDVLYGSSGGQEFMTVVRGKHEYTGNGNIMITEFEAGRLFEVDMNDNIVWEYINSYDDENVIEITEGRVYELSYFSVENWACE